jgi:hypothetical protein
VKHAPGDDELVAIVAAYVIVTREQRRLAVVPTPAARWRLAARLGDIDPSAAEALDPGRRPSRWRAPLTP